MGKFSDVVREILSTRGGIVDVWYFSSSSSLIFFFRLFYYFLNEISFHLWREGWVYRIPLSEGGHDVECVWFSTCKMISRCVYVSPKSSTSPTQIRRRRRRRGWQKEQNKTKKKFFFVCVCLHVLHVPVCTRFWLRIVIGWVFDVHPLGGNKHSSIVDACAFPSRIMSAGNNKIPPAENEPGAPQEPSGAVSFYIYIYLSLSPFWHDYSSYSFHLHPSIQHVAKSEKSKDGNEPVMNT